MSKEYAKQFYNSKAWHDCRAAYAKSVGGLCEVCLAKGVYKGGEIVHHKKHISPETINDPAVLLNWDNLQLVCRDCHADIHRPTERRWTVDEWGRVSSR